MPEPKDPVARPAFHRIVWAVDPFADAVTFHAETLRALHALTAGGQAMIEPVHVVDPGRPDFGASEYVRPEDYPDPEAKRRLRDIVAKAGVPGLTPPLVLMPKGISRRAQVRELLDHAAQSGAELVAVTTHGRKGLARLLHGSFAGACLEEAAVPILVCAGLSAGTQRVENILFLTDAPFTSGEAMDTLSAVARATGADVHLCPATNLLPEAIASAANGLRSPMIAAQLAGPGAERGLTLGDLKGIVRVATCPVLILPREARAAERVLYPTGAVAPA